MVFAVTLPVVLGALGLGTDVSVWYSTQRSMQHAADAAVLAAASNSGINYLAEAKAVAAKYGFDVTKDANVTVAASNNAACPFGGNTCYSVNISGHAPLIFSQVIGFTGNLTVNGTRQVSVSASAVATNRTAVYCLVALNTSGTAITTNGAPKADLSGCGIFSNSDANCNGHDLNADFGDAAGVNSGCGKVGHSHLPVLGDQYRSLASNIPANPCALYSWKPGRHGSLALSPSNIYGGTINLSGDTTVCGDLQLSSDVTITTTGDTVLIIENGQLDTNGHKFQTSDGSHLTLVFSGTNSGSYTHEPTGGGTLNFAAPTSGTWSGVAIYQDPILDNGIDISDAGNSPTWDITGLVYLSKSNVTFSGAVNKASTGASCFVLMVNTITINGTGSILDHGGCGDAGLAMPGTRAHLVS